MEQGVVTPKERDRLSQCCCSLCCCSVCHKWRECRNFYSKKKTKKKNKPPKPEEQSWFYQAQVYVKTLSYLVVVAISFYWFPAHSTRHWQLITILADRRYINIVRIWERVYCMQFICLLCTKTMTPFQVYSICPAHIVIQWSHTTDFKCWTKKISVYVSAMWLQSTLVAMICMDVLIGALQFLRKVFTLAYSCCIQE